MLPPAAPGPPPLFAGPATQAASRPRWAQAAAAQPGGGWAPVTFFLTFVLIIF